MKKQYSRNDYRKATSDEKQRLIDDGVEQQRTIRERLLDGCLTVQDRLSDSCRTAKKQLKNDYERFRNICELRGDRKGYKRLQNVDDDDDDEWE